MAATRKQQNKTVTIKNEELSEYVKIKEGNHRLNRSNAISVQFL
jgi:hypothetical protein